MSNDTDRTTRAGDYVLGLMSDEERERAEHDIAYDPDFRNAVLALAQKMHVFDRDAGPDPVPTDMWPAIASRIAELPQMRGVGLDAAVPEAPRLRPTPVRRRFGLHAVPGWRPALMAACLIAACGVGYLAGVGTGNRAPVVVVVLNTGAQAPGAIFEAYADNSVRILPLEDFAVPPGQTLQVWTLYDEAVGPVSLGTLGEARETVLGGSDLPVPKANQLYEITLEPAPGSPTGRPTGPILVKGFATVPPI
jgi:anti-sigma-K factor RskA